MKNVAVRSCLLLFIMLMATVSTVSAQLKSGLYEAGITGGIFVYQGDLAPSALGSYRTAGKAFSLIGERILSNDYGLRANISYGRLNGRDAAFSKPEWKRQRNFLFTSPVLELSTFLVWYPRGRDRKLSPYLAAGPGLAFIKVKRDASGLNSEFFSNSDPVNTQLTTDLAHQPPRILPVLPFGGGIRYACNSNLYLIAETFYRLSRTDYLDGFSKSAQPKLNDHYLNHSIGIIYSFSKRQGLDCPGSPR